MSTFLVATDLSARSDRAVRRAFQLARQHSAQIIVLSVVDDTLPEAMAASLTSQSVTELNRIIAADPDSAHVSHQAQVLLGDVASCVGETAEAESAELLILGLHRDRPFADLWRDTTLQRIVRKVTCPVLVVHDPVAGAYCSILAAVDFSPAVAEALRLAHKIAPGAQLSGIHALHIPYSGLMPADIEKPFMAEAETALAKWRESYPELTKELKKMAITPGSSVEVLRTALTKNQPDLLAVGAHSRTGLDRFRLGSFTTQLMRNPPCDLLIARPA